MCWKNVLALVFTLSILGTTLNAQERAKLIGRVTDQETGEEIIGASILVKGTGTGTATDIFGNYALNLVNGTHVLQLTYIGYESQEIEVVLQNAETKELNITLKPDAQQLDMVEVVAKKDQRSEASMINTVKESDMVVSGVSAELIAKQGGGSAADVMKRIPGITLIENRFVMVRGLNQRYNSVLVNGVGVPSTEPDAKVFSFDILPSSMIDQLLVYKSGSAELPGEMAGAVIDVTTRNDLTEDFNSISLSLGARVGTTGQRFLFDQGSGMDYTGFGTNNRAWGNQFPQKLSSNANEAAQQAQSLNNNWAWSEGTALPTGSISYSMGRLFDVGGLEMSNITSVGYSNDYKTSEVSNYKYSPGGTASIYNSEGNKFENSTKTYVLSNFSARWNSNNKIEFKNLFNQIGEREMFEREGEDLANNFLQKDYSMRYQSRSFYMGQLSGEHELSDDKKLTWTTGLSTMRMNEPDWKRIRYQGGYVSAEDNPNRYNDLPLAFFNQANLDYNSRYSSELNENIYNARVDYEQTFENPYHSDKKIKLNAGLYGEASKRDFSVRWTSITPFPNNAPETPVYGADMNTIFAPENFGPGGWTMREGTNPSDAYSAESTLLSGYLGASLPIGKFTFNGGARVESFNQNIMSEGLMENVDNNNLNILPFANVSYDINDKMLLRAAYSKTINRPSFRELAPFNFYDFEMRANIVGNSNLKQSEIQNIDLRWELYPSENESISIGTFYKSFKNPIEMFIQPNQNTIFTYENAEAATSAGIEVEVKKSFKDISHFDLIHHSSLSLNASLIHSTMTLGENSMEVNSERPLQGQSPYVVNLGYYYDNPQTGWAFNLLYNTYGQRIYSVGDGQNSYPWYEMPRQLIDLNISKEFNNNWEVSLNVENLLNAKYQLYVDGNADGKIDTSNENDNMVMESYSGQAFTLGLSYKF
ncbi:TonB-dependent receptor [Sediminitomix flava]|uniref:TonB-dependent receptor n=1 Tax=Sediminitomix flava TaxID=379075 RepID=UPI001304C4D1|nr:TonB-dependent receptor [Sediminitomix flava]